MIDGEIPSPVRLPCRPWINSSAVVNDDSYRFECDCYVLRAVPSQTTWSEASIFIQIKRYVRPGSRISHTITSVDRVPNSAK